MEWTFWDGVLIGFFVFNIFLIILSGIKDFYEMNLYDDVRQSRSISKLKKELNQLTSTIEKIKQESEGMDPRDKFFILFEIEQLNREIFRIETKFASRLQEAKEINYHNTRKIAGNLIEGMVKEEELKKLINAKKSTLKRISPENVVKAIKKRKR